MSAAFLYDGDGRRVKGVADGVTTLYVNEFYEIEGSTVRKYYSAGGQRIAVRENGVLSYLLSDHLGSITVSLDGQNLTGTRSYSSWGETRGSAGTLPTGRGYQGQHAEDELGLLFFNARWVDPELGRFISADTIIPEPGNPGDWDRYAFVLNNPVNKVDPSGHFSISDWLNPLTYDVLSVGVKIDAKIIGGVEAYATLNVNSKAIREGDWKNFDMSLSVDGAASAGISAEGDILFRFGGSDGSVKDLSGVKLFGADGAPVNVGGCVGGGCISANATFDENAKKWED